MSMVLRKAFIALHGRKRIASPPELYWPLVPWRRAEVNNVTGLGFRVPRELQGILGARLSATA